jgi:hypothetical protein
MPGNNASLQTYVCRYYQQIKTEAITWEVMFTLYITNYLYSSVELYTCRKRLSLYEKVTD